MSKSKGKYVFEVNGQDVHTDDDDIKGQDVRSLSGHDPAADYRLIEIRDRYTTSIGLEDPISVEEGEKRVFRIWEGDRDYDFTVEDRGWEWGAATISEADVREIAHISADKTIVVELPGEPELIVPKGGQIDLSGSGVERLYGRKIASPSKLHLVFIVNGEPMKATVAPGDRLHEVLATVLKDSENTGQPVEAWQVTDEPGTILDVTKTFAELGVHDGAVLVVSLKAGAAG